MPANPDQSLFEPRERRSLNGFFSIRGPSILDEGSKGQVVVFLQGNPPIGADERLSIEAPGPLLVLDAKGKTLTQRDLAGQPDGRIAFHVAPDGRTNKNHKGFHAVEATFTVELPRLGDTVPASMCIRRSRLRVLTESISIGDATLTKLAGSAVVGAIIAAIPIVVFFVSGLTEAVITTATEGLIASIILFFVLKNAFFGRDQAIAEVLEKTRRRERF